MMVALFPLNSQNNYTSSFDVSFTQDFKFSSERFSVYFSCTLTVNTSWFSLTDSVIAKTLSVFVCLLLGLLCMDDWEVS